MQDFSIFTKRTLNGSVVHMEGFLDYDASLILKHQLDLVFDSGGINLVIDLKRAIHLDNTTFGILNCARRRAQEIGGKLAIVFPDENEYMLRVFSRTGLDKYFNIFKSAEEANDFLSSSNLQPKLDTR